MSKQNPKDINEVLDDLAHDVVRTAKGDVSFEEKLDAFKALTAYAALRHKMRLKGDDLDEDGEPTMDDLRNVISLGSKK